MSHLFRSLHYPNVIVASASQVGEGIAHGIRMADTVDRIIWLRDGRVDRAHGAIGSS